MRKQSDPDPATARWLQSLLTLLALCHIGLNLFIVWPSLWQNALHFCGFAALALIYHPLQAGKSSGWARLCDWTLGALLVVSVILLVARETSLYRQGLVFGWLDWCSAIIVVLAAIELTRRTTGPLIPVLIVLALSYVVVWGSWLPGVFRFPGLSLETVLFRSIYGDDGLFGSIATISSTFVFMFILFGAFLLRSGGGQFVIDIARALSGRFAGSGGVVAVLASGLMGSISGSAVANTASTGVITIPLMKKSGFAPRFSAAVEAAASTGGQLMPPIMGAGAFIMAGYTQLPYTHIIAAALLPAVLYFASVIFFVRAEALRTDMRAPAHNQPALGEVCKRGGIPFFVPVGVLVGALLWGLTPTYAAGLALLAVVASSWPGRAPMGLQAILEALAAGARGMVVTAVLLCSVGLVVNVIAMTGVGNTLSLMITSWAGGSLIIAMLLVAIASLALGAGLPVTAAYVVLASLCAPALATLISNRYLVDLFIAGTLAPEALTLLRAAGFELAARVTEGLSPEQARQVVETLPPDLLLPLRELLLPAAELQLAVLSAHMVIFWLSQDSNVTPPVCLTAFTAAAIAGTRPMATGVASWRLAKGLYVVPLLFAYTPLLSSDWRQALPVFLFALFGLYCLVGALQGYLQGRLRWWQRLLAGTVGALLVYPLPPGMHLAVAVAAMIMLAVFSGMGRTQAARSPNRQGRHV